MNCWIYYILVFTLAIGERLLQRLSYPIDFKEETTWITIENRWSTLF